MRKSFAAWVLFLTSAQLVILALQVDHWPFTCYPMYAVKRWYQNDVLHVGARGADGKPVFLAHPLNWMMNGPRFERPLSSFEARYVHDLLTFACPNGKDCHILKTKVVRKEDGSFEYQTSFYQ